MIVRRYLLFPTIVAIGLITILSGLVLALFYLRNLFALGIEKQVPFWLLFKIFAYTQTAQLGFALMLAVMPGAVLALGNRLYHNEILALRAAGMSHYQLLRPFLVPGIILLGMGMLLHQLVTPWARGEFRELRSFMEEYAPLDLAADGANNFSAPARNGRMRHVRFDTKQFDHRLRTHKFRKVHIVETGSLEGKEKILQFIEADSAFAFQVPDRLAGGGWRYLRLESGFLVDFEPAMNYDTRVISFQNATMDILLAAPGRTLVAGERAKDSLFPGQLLRKREALRVSQNRADIEDRLDYDHEFHQRLALPFALPLTLFCGVLVALIAGARWRWHAVTMAILIAGGYYAAFLFAKMFAVKNQAIPVVVAAWLPNLLIAIPTGALLINLRRR